MQPLGFNQFPECIISCERVGWRDTNTRNKKIQYQMKVLDWPRCLKVWSPHSFQGVPEWSSPFLWFFEPQWHLAWRSRGWWWSSLLCLPVDKAQWLIWPQRISSDKKLGPSEPRTHQTRCYCWWSSHQAWPETWVPLWWCCHWWSLRRWSHHWRPISWPQWD